MKKVLIFGVCLAMLAVFYGCAHPGAVSQSTSAPSEGDPGTAFFTAATSFQPGTCVETEQALSLVTHSSSVTIGWDRDSLGAAAAQIGFVRPSVDVGDGKMWIVFCNLSPDVVTVPALASVSYELLNGAPATEQDVTALKMAITTR